MGMILESVENTPEAWSERARIAETAYEAAGWSEHGQRCRFDAVIRALDPRRGEQMLDYGCGTGLLSEWIQHDVDYLGFDSSPGMVARAQREHPERSFQSWEPYGGYGFDLIACIGLFNLPGNWSKEMTWATIRRLWDDFTPRALAVSLYSGTDDRCLIYNRGEVERVARGLSYYHSVVQHMPNDLLMIVRREQA